VGVVKRQEPVGIEAFAAEFAVKRLGEGVTRWFHGPGEVQFDAALIGPEVAGDELGSMVDPDRFRIAEATARMFQHRNSESLFRAMRSIRKTARSAPNPQQLRRKTQGRSLNSIT
jgi:hypothetical protein